MQHSANLVRTCLYLELQNIYKYIPTSTLLYLVCTWYVLVHTQKKKKPISITLGVELWISCIASCALYHYATSVHSVVVSMDNTKYIPTETYTRVARYLLAGVGSQALVQPLPWPWLLP